MTRTLAAAAVAVMSVLAACSAPKAVYEDHSAALQRELLWVERGVTTRQDALMKLGLPSAQFEGDRILTWRLALTKDETLVPVTRALDAADPRILIWRKASYSLVLVFAADGRVEEFSLVRVKQ